MEEKVDFAQYVNIARMDLDEIQQVIFLSLSASCQKEKWPPSITPQKKGGEIPLKKKFLPKWNAEEGWPKEASLALLLLPLFPYTQVVVTSATHHTTLIRWNFFEFFAALRDFEEKPSSSSS